MRVESATSSSWNRAMNLIEDAFNAQKWKKVIHLSRLAIACAPERHWAYDRLGVAQTKVGDFTGARRSFESGLKIEPTCPLLLVDRASLAFAEGDEHHGLLSLEKLLKNSLLSLSDHPCSEGVRWMRSLYLDALVDAGVASFRLGRFREAGRYFDAHLKQRRRGTPCHNSKREIERARAAATKLYFQSKRTKR